MNTLSRIYLLFSSLFLFNSFTASALNEFGGDWSGQLNLNGYPNPIKLTIKLTHNGGILKGPARLELWDGSYIAVTITDGLITNTISDSLSGKLNGGDVAFTLPTLVDSSKGVDMRSWLGRRYTGRITASNNGYEIISGKCDNGTFYLRKGNTLTQILADVISRELVDYLKRGTYEADNVYQPRTTQAKIDSVADTTVAIFFREWVESNPIKLKYDRPKETFTIDPIITDSFLVRVPLEDAKCFEEQFPKWAMEFLRFQWNKTDQKAEVQKFVFEFECAKKKVQVNFR